MLQVLNSSLVGKFNQQKLYLGDYKTMPILMGHFYVKFELACGVWHMKGHEQNTEQRWTRRKAAGRESESEGASC